MSLIRTTRFDAPSNSSKTRSMKTQGQRFLAACIGAFASFLSGGASVAQVSGDQINWGSLDGSSIVDSNGVTLEAASFTFELGAFASGFTPTESNVSDWFGNWYAFGRATYHEAGGVFAGQYGMYDSTYTDHNNGQFEDLGIGRDAYIWVYNSKEPLPGVEWFVARANNWSFPDFFVDCCNNALPIEWSMSDLESINIPLWGNQLGIQGPGLVNHFNGIADLQTYAVIPEPSSTLFLAFAGLMGVLRRSRPKS